MVFDTITFPDLSNSITLGGGGSFSLLNNGEVANPEPAIYYVQYSAHAVSETGEVMGLSLSLNGAPIAGSQAISAISAAPNVVAGGSIFPTDITENPNSLLLNNISFAGLTDLSATISIIKLL